MVLILILEVWGLLGQGGMIWVMVSTPLWTLILSTPCLGFRLSTLATSLILVSMIGSTEDNVFTSGKRSACKLVDEIIDSSP